VTPSRRQILQGALALPFLPAQPSLLILKEDHCLSQESARGFEKAFQKVAGWRKDLILVTGARSLTPARAHHLRQQVLAGACLFFESAPTFSPQQAQLLMEVFELHVSAPISLTKWSGDYVEYSRPVPQLVRPFEAAVPVASVTGVGLAQLNGITIALRQSLGRGVVIFLGSMLGPGLFAEEREACSVASALLQTS
jgi:hypothetical protein